MGLWNLMLGVNVASFLVLCYKQSVGSNVYFETMIETFIFTVTKKAYNTKRHN